MDAGNELDGAVCGHHPAPVQEISLQQPAHQNGIPQLVENVLGSQGEKGGRFGVGEDFFHFLQSRGRHHEAQLPAGGLFGMVGPSCQAEAVHRHGGDGIGSDLEFHAVVDGPGLVVRHGEDGAGNQLLQLVLGDADGMAGAHVRQIRVFIGGFGADGEGGVAGTDGHPEIVVHHHGDAALGQAADDVAEELGRENALPVIGHVGGDLVGDGGFHIIAGEGQTRGARPA